MERFFPRGLPSLSLSPLTSSFSSHSLHLHLPHSHLSSPFTFIARLTAPPALKSAAPAMHQALLHQPSSNSPPLLRLHRMTNPKVVLLASLPPATARYYRRRTLLLVLFRFTTAHPHNFFPLG